jgi:ASPIC/UnbV protein
MTVTTGETRQVATIPAGSSYLSYSPPIAAFGLGQNTQVDSIEVVFPDGMQASLASPEVNNVVLHL